MNKQVRYRMKRLERHHRLKQLRSGLDYITTTVSHKYYNGDNPAMNAAYGPLRASLIIMLALAFVIFGVGSLAPIESAAVAKGTIVVSSNKKTIQHLEGGIIRKILVEDGDLVKMGQPLIELSDVASKASRNMARSELYAGEVAQARLLALKQGKDEMTIDNKILEAARDNEQLAKTIDSQRDQFETQKSAQEGKIKTLEQRIKQYDEEILGLQAQVKSANRQIQMMVQEIEPMRRLVAKGYAAKPQLLALERQQEELEGNMGQYTANIAKARESTTETQMQVHDAKNEFATQVAEELRTTQSKISDDEEKLNATSDVVKRTVITAPYEGIVTGLKYHTEGGVVTAGLPIMDIVPQHDALLVEAHIQPTDIDVVHAGLPARLVFSAFNSRKMPRLTGKVTYVSADAVSPPQESQTVQPYYVAKVQVDSQELAKLDEQIVLTPGMPVEVYIRTGSRSFLGYLVAPIRNSMGRAFLED